MACSSNNGDAPSSPPDQPIAGADKPDEAAGTPETLPSEALARFHACRWMQPAENGNPEFCTHREVKPYAGSSAFDASAWCPSCAYYKLRRTPKKRSPDDYRN